jgi:predicted dehydrogenase
MVANAAHIPAWKDQSEAQVVAVADIREDIARATAARHQLPAAYADVARMLREAQPEVVCVCSPNRYHKEHAIAALEAGAHVLCEKPVAGSLADAAAMFRAAEAAGRVLLVGQSLRFYNPLIAARQFAAAGELGETYYAETACWRRRGVPTWGLFHIKAHSEGGPLFDVGVHMLDAIIWLMGNPRITAASGATYCKLARREENLATSLAESGAFAGVFDPRPYDYREFDVEDLGVGFLRLANGATIILRASWAANIPHGSGATVVLGTEGGIRLEANLSLQVLKNMCGYQVDITPQVPREARGEFPGHWKLARHMLRVIRGEEPPLVTRDEVLNVISGLEALYRSAALGRDVATEELAAAVP